MRPFFFALLLVLCGCPDTPPPPATLQIGTGMVDTFVLVNEDDTVLLARGCQGGQHVWLSLRTTGVDTQPALIQAVLERQSDGEAISIPLQVRLSFQERAEFDELTGLQLVVNEPDLAIAEPMRIAVRVFPSGVPEAAVESERNVTVVWGEERCLDAGDAGT